MPGAAPFHDLSQEQLRELLLRLRLHAQWKVRVAAHRDASLDPQHLALQAVAGTLDGTRRFDAQRVNLLRHLTGCVDSDVSQRHGSAGSPPVDPDAQAPELAARMPATGPGPEEHLKLERELLRRGVELDGDVDEVLRSMAGAPAPIAPLASLDQAALGRTPLQDVERRLRDEGVDMNQWLSRAQVLIRGQRLRSGSGAGSGAAGPPAAERGATTSCRRRSRRVNRAVASGLVVACASGIAFMVIHDQGLLTPAEIPMGLETTVGAGSSVGSRQPETARTRAPPVPPRASTAAAPGGSSPGTTAGLAPTATEGPADATARGQLSVQSGSPAGVVSGFLRAPDAPSMLRREVQRDLAAGQPLEAALTDMGVTAADRRVLLQLLGPGPFRGPVDLRVVFAGDSVQEVDFRSGARGPVRIRRGGDGRLAHAGP